MTDGPVADPAALALVAEACRKSDLVWVRAPAHRARAVWHVWHEGAVLLVVGGGEQPDPVGDATTVTVQARSKDTWARLVSFPARVDPVGPDDARWDASTFALKAKRLNAPEPATMVARWAAGSRVLRLVPEGEPEELPGAYDDASGAEPPTPSPAVTVSWRPFHLGGRGRA